MKKSFLILFIVAIFFVFCKQEEFNLSEFDPNYPTKYCVVDKQLRENLNHSLKAGNEILIMEVDSFGFMQRDWNLPIPASIFEGQINNQDSVLMFARNFLYKYSELTGVKDTSELVVNRIKGSWASYGKYIQKNDNENNRWFVQFEEQKFNNIKVFGTRLGVYVCPQGVYQMYGNWFPYIYLPSKERISFSEAKEKLIGRTLDYYDWTGGKQWTISQKDFYSDDNPQKAIFPFRNNDCIELRVCWFIRTKSLWNFYVDLITGELIYNEQTIIF